ncbi:MAG: rod shape-determining protein RodA [Phycisphaerales bacterium]|nr:rod shape-determining protein RodA [Phycisphaerales bacterium]
MAPILVLSTIGLATIHVTDSDRAAVSSTATTASDAAGIADWLASAMHIVGPYTTRQSVFLLAGFALMLLMIWPSYQNVGPYSYAVYWLVVFLLALLVVDRFIDLPFIPVRRDTRRWVEVTDGLGIQPSEFMKPALILALAYHLRFRESVRTVRGLVLPFLMTLLPMGLIHFQPDLGTLLMLLPVLFAMLFAATAKKRHLVAVMLIGVALAPPFYMFGMKEYQKKRIDVLLRQERPDERWHMNEGYQLRQAKIALGTGGVWGEGLGHGVFVQQDLLPEAHNDFIFAMIGHQWGMAGAILVLIAYGLIVILGLEIALLTNDPFGRLLAVGVIIMIVAQALLNIGMVIGFFPITGMTLPFVSYGGSSLWANFLGLGLLINVAQRRPMLISKPPFAYESE